MVSSNLYRGEYCWFWLNVEEALVPLTYILLIVPGEEAFKV
jgi:hypothetical protein